jgi:thiamine-phosphate diphosphorylase / hydroxyethylthiazole kinase
MAVNYSVYLVTDSTSAILGDRDIVAVVEAALRGGVTILQYRDKTAEHHVAVETARKLHEVAKRFGVPLLINDRVEVAVEVGCEGVHIGQDDMGTYILQPFTRVIDANEDTKRSKRPENSLAPIKSSA